MAFARLAFRVLLILLILLVAIGVLLPSSTTVERRIVINAPPSVVFPHVNGMRAFHTWSPWRATDSQIHYEFSGPEQGVGSRMSWASGDQRVGQGSQEITSSTSNQEVKTVLQFGDKGSGAATFALEPRGQSTELRWRFDTEFGWDLFGRYIGLMMDNMIGAQYDKGLKELKALIEKPDA